ncbi:MAG: hypothetical protein KGL12_15040 [Rhodospirillales bacterium]|nr:hypothetical protein [Rhodospirillales bacterium]
MSILVLAPLVRALTTALLVVSASVAAEALGPFWGALIAAMPVSTGPAYVFLAMRHGPDFIAASALASFVANASTGIFLIVYARLAPRISAWPALGCAVLAWLAASLALHGFAWTPLRGVVTNLLVYGVGCALPVAAVGRSARDPDGRRPMQRRWFELPIRAAAVAVFVAAVVALSAAIGPAATGMAAVFPISLISLIVVVRPRLGAAAVAVLAANALRAMIGFGLMLLVLACTAKPLGTAPALIIALAVFLCWSACLLLWRHAGQRRAASTRQ